MKGASCFGCQYDIEIDSWQGSFAGFLHVIVCPSKKYQDPSKEIENNEQLLPVALSNHKHCINYTVNHYLLFHRYVVSRYGQHDAAFKTASTNIASFT